MCEECSICYENNPSCRLICGHVFHHSCIKEWYILGQNKGCPMCRNSICFRGMYKMKKKWDDEHKEKQFSEVYDRYVHRLLENTNEELSYLTSEPNIEAMIQYDFLMELKLLEKDYIQVKQMVDDPESLDFLLDNMNVFCLNNGPPIYYDPIKTKPSKYRKKRDKIKHYHR